jgi:hypothetical protein
MLAPRGAKEFVMSELAKQLFTELKHAAQSAAPGLKNFLPEVGAEFKRLNTQATMEIASALFGNGAFVPYGPGQYTPDSASQEQAASAATQQPERERSGMGR